MATIRGEAEDCAVLRKRLARMRLIVDRDRADLQRIDRDIGRIANQKTRNRAAIEAARRRAALQAPDLPFLPGSSGTRDPDGRSRPRARDVDLSIPGWLAEEGFEAVQARREIRRLQGEQAELEIRLQERNEERARREASLVQAFEAQDIIGDQMRRLACRRG